MDSVAKSEYTGKNSTLLRSLNKTKNYIWKKRFLYLLLVLPFTYLIIFHYIPMYGLLIAFQKYVPGNSFIGSRWIGFSNFQLLFDSQPFMSAFKNTMIISLYRIFFGFPIPIILALLLNEVRNIHFKKTIQSVIYFPYFVSWIIVGGILLSLLSADDGLLNQIFNSFGMNSIPFMTDPRYFRSILVISGIWKEAGWQTVIYIAALAGINMELYEAAIIDGANRWQQTIYITLPGITSTIAVLFILAFSNIMSAGFDQIFVLLNPMVTDVGEIIDTFVYKVGIVGSANAGVNYSLATAVGLFKGIIAFLLLSVLNNLSKRIRGEKIY